MMTGCCACPARSAALTSKGFTEAVRNIFITLIDRCYSGPIKRLNRALLLDYNRSSHLRVNRAKVAISPWSARHDRVGLIRIEPGRFLELLANAYDCVRFLVPIDPGYLLTGLDRDILRIKSEVFDLDFVFLAVTCAGILHLASYGEERETGQKRCNRNFANDRFHRFELFIV